MEELMNLKKLFDAGLMTEDEFNQRRISMIDQITATSLTQKSPNAIQKPAQNNANAPAPPPQPHASFHYNDNPTLQYLVPAGHQGEPADNSFQPGSRRLDSVPNFTEKKSMDVGSSSASAAPPAPPTNEESKRKLGWQLFHAASVNDVTKLKDLIDRGADPNQRDMEKEGTAVILASEKGNKHACYYLVERGAYVNAQNVLGETALHKAVEFKYNEMALWLVKKGADIHLENFKGLSAVDIALPWLQKELRDEYDTYNKEKKKQKLREAAQGGIQNNQPIQAQMGMEPGMGMMTIQRNAAQPLPESGSQTIKRDMPPPQSAGEILRIFLKNNSYKSVLVAPDTNAQDLAALVAEKLDMQKFTPYLEVLERTPGGEVRLEPTITILQHRKKWPVLYAGKSDDCKLLVFCKRGTPDAVQMMYRDAMYGNKEK